MPGVEMLVLELPRAQADPDVVAALVDVVETQQIAVLDLVVLARQDDGQVRIVEAQPDLEKYGWGATRIAGRTLLSAEDLDAIGAGMAPGTSAAVLVCETLWSARLTDAVIAAGGQVALHVQIPVEAVTSGRW